MSELTVTNSNGRFVDDAFCLKTCGTEVDNGRLQFSFYSPKIFLLPKSGSELNWAATMKCKQAHSPLKKKKKSALVCKACFF